MSPFEFDGNQPIVKQMGDYRHYPYPKSASISEIKQDTEVHPAVVIGLIGAVLVPLLIALLANKSKPASLPAPLEG